MDNNSSKRGANKMSTEVWIVINEKTHKLMFYGTRSEADFYKNDVKDLVTDPLKVRLLRVGMTIYEKGGERTK